MREKILAELRKKYPGLRNDLLGLVADKLAAKVTEEGQIEGAVGELENLPISLTDFANSLQKEGDRRVTEAQKEWEKKNPKPADPKDPKTDPLPDDAPAWAKGLMTQLAEQTQTIQKLQAEKQQSSLTDQLKAKLAEKKIPLALLKGRTVEKAEDLDTVLAEIETDFATLKQDLVNDGLMTQATPKDGLPGAGDAKAVEADIAAHFAKPAESKS